LPQTKQRLSEFVRFDPCELEYIPEGDRWRVAGAAREAALPTRDGESITRTNDDYVQERDDDCDYWPEWNELQVWFRDGAFNCNPLELRQLRGELLARVLGPLDFHGPVFIHYWCGCHASVTRIAALLQCAAKGAGSPGPLLTRGPHS